MRIILVDAMVGVDPEENVEVTCDPNYEDLDDESIYLSFHIGEDDEEVCFAIDRGDVGRWEKTLREAADKVLNTAELLHRRFDGGSA